MEAAMNWNEVDTITNVDEDKGKVYFVNGEGDEGSFDVPTVWEICGACEGHGTRLNRSIGEHAYTMEEFRESFDDEEAEEYFKRGGRYDVACDQCHDGKVRVASFDELPEQIMKLIEEFWREEANYRATCRAERAMGC